MARSIAVEASHDAQEERPEATQLAVYGPGAVGLVMGARLARAGCDVLFVGRRAEQVRHIEESGVSVEDPATGERWTTRVRAALPDAARDALHGRLVIFSVRTSQNEPAARALARLTPDATLAVAQNDVDGDALLARWFPRVIGVVVRQTCTRIGDAAARTSGAGRLVLGAHPEGGGPDVDALAAVLRAAGYDVGVSPRIARDRWLKLCVNLMSAPNALVRREDHVTPAFVEIKARLLEEARAILAAAGIEAASCDGRDRTLDEEIAHQRASLAAGSSRRSLPLYNQTWQALRRGSGLEADRYHRRLLELAVRHGVPAPVNARMLEVLERCARERRGPESIRASDVLATPAPGA